MNSGGGSPSLGFADELPRRAFGLTCDVDWAPDYVLNDTLELLESCGVTATILATHETSVLRGLDHSKYEIGIHPNFNSLLAGESGNSHEIIADLLTSFPEAVCVRAHCLVESSLLFDVYSEMGLKYELTQFLPYQPNIHLHYHISGLIRVPFNWEDDYHFLSQHSFATSKLDQSEYGLDIYNFHPVHLYLNTESPQRYREAKTLLYSGGDIEDMRNNGPEPGTRDLFVNLFGSQPTAERPDCTMLIPEIVNTFGHPST